MDNIDSLVRYARNTHNKYAADEEVNKQNTLALMTTREVAYAVDLVRGVSVVDVAEFYHRCRRELSFRLANNCMACQY